MHQTFLSIEICFYQGVLNDESHFVVTRGA